MAPLLLLVWAGAFVLAPGMALEHRLRPAGRARSLPVRIAWSLAFGSGFLTVVAIALQSIGALGLPWLAVSTLTAVSALYASADRRRRPVPRRAREHIFWTMASLVIAAAFVLMSSVSDYGFGEDSYYWAGVARSLALGFPGWVHGAETVQLAILRPAPIGYGYLLSTAALIVPRLHGGESLVVIGLLWLLFALCSAFALGSRLSGSAVVGSLGAILYVGSYWILYHSLHSISRQGIALGFAPLVLLVLVRKGHRSFRATELYLLLGTLWLVHAFTALILLCLIPPLLTAALWRRGPQRLTRYLGIMGSLGALGLSAPGTYVIGRFSLSALGVIHFFEHPNIYRMRPWDPLTVMQTVGPITIAILLAGLLWWTRTARGMAYRARGIALWLTLLLVAVGMFHQSWYRSTGVGLPPERYYTFYSFGALLWFASAASMLSRQRPAVFTRPIIAAACVLVWSQLLFDGFFVLRMLRPRPEMAALFKATRQLESDAGLGDTVFLALQQPLSGAGASLVRSVLAPRRAVVLAPHEGITSAVELARRDGGTFLIVDRKPLPETDGSTFFDGNPGVWLVDLRFRADRRRSSAVLIYAGS